MASDPEQPKPKTDEALDKALAYYRLIVDRNLGIDYETAIEAAVSNAMQATGLRTQEERAQLTESLQLKVEGLSIKGGLGHPLVASKLRRKTAPPTGAELDAILAADGLPQSGPVYDSSNAPWKQDETPVE